MAVPTSRQCYKGETKRCWLEVLGGQDAISKAGLQGDEAWCWGPASPLVLQHGSGGGRLSAVPAARCAVPVSLLSWRAAGSGLSGPGGRSRERQLLPQQPPSPSRASEGAFLKGAQANPLHMKGFRPGGLVWERVLQMCLIPHFEENLKPDSLSRSLMLFPDPVSSFPPLTPTHPEENRSSLCNLIHQIKHSSLLQL